MIDGLTLHAIDEGPTDAARTVVLLHGTPGSIDDWVPVRETLRPGYPVVTPERLGMGWADAACAA